MNAPILVFEARLRAIISRLSFGKVWFALSFLIFLIAPLRSQAQQFLVQNGQAQAEIITAPAPSRMAALAAEELQTYIEKISGAQLPILTQPGSAPVKIYVGQSSYTTQLGLQVSTLNDGAFRIAAGSGWLALTGRDHDFVPVEPWGRNRQSAEETRVRQEWDLITGEKFESPFFSLGQHYFTQHDVWEFDEAGTLNAVYEFLRRLGVRWYAPTELGEVVPQTANIALPAAGNELVTPDFPVRDMKLYYTHEDLGDLAIWKLRLGATPGARFIGSTQPGHGIKFVLMRQEFKNSYPTAFALRSDGLRETTYNKSGMPCLSSETLFQKHVQYVRALFDHYGEKVVSIDMPDGFGSHACVCSLCTAQYTPERGADGKLSDYVWGYLNRVAQEVYLTHPDRKVSGLVYSAYRLPPEDIQQMSPNLVLIECRWRSNFDNADYKQFYTDLRAAWLPKLPSQEYAVWDYYLHNQPETAAVPTIFPTLIKADLAALKNISRGDTLEVYNSRFAPANDYPAFALNHVNLYITSRLWWNANQNVQTLMEEYYTLFYGPARDQMKSFLEYCEANRGGLKTSAAVLDEAMARLNAAVSAAPVGSAYRQRIDKIAAQHLPAMQTFRQSLFRNTSTDDTSYRLLRVQDATQNDMLDKPLNGILDPAYWPAVRVRTLQKIVGGTSQPSTTFQMLTGNNNIYLGIRCNEPNMTGITIPTLNSGDPAILTGDFISFMVETPTRSYYEIIVNAAGAVYEKDHGVGGDPEWTSGVQIGVHHDTNFWSLELRIPVAGEGARLIDPQSGIDGNLPRLFAPWYFNVSRLRMQNGVVVSKQVYYVGSSQDIREIANMAHIYVK